MQTEWFCLFGLNSFKTMTYSEKLKHPKWQKKRLEIMQRDGFRCRSCGNDDNQLHVHHILYDSQYKNPWDYPDYLLITFCNNCHELEHGIIPEGLAMSILLDLIKISFQYSTTRSPTCMLYFVTVPA